MKKLSLVLLAFLQVLLISGQTSPGKLPVKMEELTSPQFSQAVKLSGGVCLVPLGVIEKHGPHLPIGTDLFEAREAATMAARKEYAVVYPPYFAGQIFEAKHQPGTIAYSSELMWKLLEETCMELSRNGLKKIILVNGHGGNNAFLQFFCQSQLASERDYTVVFFQENENPRYSKEIAALKKAKLDGHAGEEETSMMTYIRPDLVDVQAIKSQSGLDQNRLPIPFGYTGIWWYAKYPNHFASDVAEPNKRLGELLMESWSDQIAELIRYMKTNNSVIDMQNEFFNRAKDPLK